MKVVEPSFEILAITKDPEKLVELAGRVCYKSEASITDDSATAFVARIRTSQHASVLEHASMTVRFVCDRGVSHELVRHRIASYSQTSSRYCNYSKGKFGGELTFIAPVGIELGTREYDLWFGAMSYAEQSYMALLAIGMAPDQARSVLPTCTKTQVVMTANFREWAHVFELRTSNKAHPDMRRVMVPLRERMATLHPAFFG